MKLLRIINVAMWTANTVVWIERGTAAWAALGGLFVAFTILQAWRAE